jgi:uncharacterized membrane protein
MNAIEIAHPWMLVLLVPLVLLLWIGQRRSLADLNPASRRICTIVRALVLLLIVLALARIHVLRTGGIVSTMFVIDESASISAEARKQARDFLAAGIAAKPVSALAGVVTFASEPSLVLPPTTESRTPEIPESQNRNHTDISRALDFAGALLPAETHRRVVLLSDGNDTSDHAAEAARRLAASGVELATVALRNPESPEVLVERVEMPSRLKTGEAFDLTARIRSNVDTTAKAKIYQNQFLVEQRDLTLKPGVNSFTASNLRAEGTFVTYEVEIVPAQDTVLENNRAQATATLRGQPRVLIVDSDETKMRPLADALRREKIQAETRATNGLPRTLEDLQQFDLLALSDISSLALTREQMELYRRWVQDFGGGFVMLGGESSYGVGGYYRTPIEQLLPVRMEHQDRQDMPSVALLIVLDRSGSMTALVQGQTKMSLADQGAVFALNVLQPRDYFGVLAVDVRSHTVAPLAQHGNRDPIAQKIMTVTAGGGGIYIYTALAEAFAQIRDVPARIKHVILFSDAADAEEKNAGEMGDGAPGSGSSLDLASAMLSSKVTTSIVALGLDTDRDTAFLRQLAERGNGRFYLTSDATTLPQIFSTETMKVAQSSLIEEPFQAVPVKPSTLLSGIDWAQSPLLLGYNSTKPKPTADVLLATERGEPLLATWRYGLGQAAAFTSDAKPRWASEWLAWPGFGKFWAQLIRGLMRKSDQTSFALDTREEGDRLTLLIDAIKPDGSFRNQLPLTVNALRPDGASTTLTPTQEGPGHYRTDFALPSEGTTLFSITSPDLPDGGATVGHTRSYPREFLANTTNESLLRELANLTGGTFSPSPASLWQPPVHATPQRHELTDWFLIAALALIPLDIYLRRRSPGR